jgi:hypothetical protein
VSLPSIPHRAAVLCPVAGPFLLKKSILLPGGGVNKKAASTAAFFVKVSTAFPPFVEKQAGFPAPAPKVLHHTGERKRSFSNL